MPQSKQREFKSAVLLYYIIATLNAAMHTTIGKSYTRLIYQTLKN